MFTPRRSKITFNDIETGSLRAVYLLTTSALAATHHLPHDLMSAIADAVLEAYIGSKCPPLPLATTQMEEMAMMSIELLAHSHADVLIARH